MVIEVVMEEMEVIVQGNSIRSSRGYTSKEGTSMTKHVSSLEPSPSTALSEKEQLDQTE